jgi:hypothetical protein
MTGKAVKIDSKLGQFLGKLAEMTSYGPLAGSGNRFVAGLAAAALRA